MILYAVVCSTVRRLWVVVAGLVGLVVGFLVGAHVRLWPWQAAWFEAAGTWVSAGLSAAILVWLAVRAEKHAKELEAARQARDEELAVRSEKLAKELEATRQARDEDETRRREKAEADGVVCETYPTDSHSEDGMIVTTVVVVVVKNHTAGVLRKLTCHVPFGGIGSVKLADAVHARRGAYQPATQRFGADKAKCRRSRAARTCRFHVLAEWGAVVSTSRRYRSS